MTNSRTRLRQRTAAGGQNTSAEWYRLREGNEARRDERREVRAPDSTGKPGNGTVQGPGGEKRGAKSSDRWRET